MLLKELVKLARDNAGSEPSLKQHRRHLQSKTHSLNQSDRKAVEYELFPCLNPNE